VQALRIGDLLDAMQRGDDLPGWVEQSAQDGYLVHEHVGQYGSRVIHVQTQTGWEVGREDDMLVRWPLGEVEPVRRDLFDAAYDRVDYEKR
jgi:hypothetical protein